MKEIVLDSYFMIMLKKVLFLFQHCNLHIHFNPIPPSGKDPSRHQQTALLFQPIEKTLRNPSQ